jgi:hypothetical protein
MPPALLVQTCRYAATNFGPAKAGLPAAYPARQPRDLRLQLDIQLSKNAGSCCLGSRSNATIKHTVTILLCICQGEFTPKFPAETRG